MIFSSIPILGLPTLLMFILFPNFWTIEDCVRTVVLILKKHLNLLRVSAEANLPLILVNCYFWYLKIPFNKQLIRPNISEGICYFWYLKISFTISVWYNQLLIKRYLLKHLSQVTWKFRYLKVPATEGNFQLIRVIMTQSFWNNVDRSSQYNAHWGQ